MDSIHSGVQRCPAQRNAAACVVIQVFAFGCFRGFKFRLKQLQVAEADNRPDKAKGTPRSWPSTSMSGRSRATMPVSGKTSAERTARERGTQFRIGRRSRSDEPEPDIAGDPPGDSHLARRAQPVARRPHRLAARLGAKTSMRPSSPAGRAGTASARWCCGRPMPSIRRLRRPASLPEEWDNDPALVRSNVAGFRSRYSHLVRNVELWLPNPFDFTFEGEDVDGRRVVVGSTATLSRQLEELNAATWKADAEIVAAWGRDAAGRQCAARAERALCLCRAARSRRARRSS